MALSGSSGLLVVSGHSLSGRVPWRIAAAGGAGGVSAMSAMLLEIREKPCGARPLMAGGAMGMGMGMGVGVGVACARLPSCACGKGAGCPEAIACRGGASPVARVGGRHRDNCALETSPACRCVPRGTLFSAPAAIETGMTAAARSRRRFSFKATADRSIRKDRAGAQSASNARRLQRWRRGGAVRGRQVPDALRGALHSGGALRMRAMGRER